MYPNYAGSGIPVLSCDGDPTIREGDRLRFWSSVAGGTAHEAWIGTGFLPFHNSGPGGCIQTTTMDALFAGRGLIQIVSRMHPRHVAARTQFASSKLGQPWSALYNCQDFASEVATGRPSSFQRDCIAGLLFTVIAPIGLMFLMGRK